MAEGWWGRGRVGWGKANRSGNVFHRRLRASCRGMYDAIRAVIVGKEIDEWSFWCDQATIGLADCLRRTLNALSLHVNVIVETPAGRRNTECKACVQTYGSKNPDAVVDLGIVPCRAMNLVSIGAINPIFLHGGAWCGLA